MDTEDGGEKIADDEIVYRRVPAKLEYYVPANDRPVQWITFQPNRNDLSGISVWRAKHVRPDEAVQTARPGRSYYLIALNVSDLRRLGAEVVASPGEGGPGHASITSLSWSRYRGPQKKDVMELASRIAFEACQVVLGPFHVPDAEPRDTDTDATPGGH
jgi:hypothetical protein